MTTTTYKLCMDCGFTNAADRVQCASCRGVALADEVGALTDEERKQLDQLDHLLSARVGDYVGESLEHMLDGHMFRAGRSHLLAEQSASGIRSERLRSICQQLVSVSFNMASRLDRIGRVNGEAVNVERVRLIDLFLNSETWCRMRGQDAVGRLMVRRQKILVR